MCGNFSTLRDPDPNPILLENNFLLDMAKRKKKVQSMASFHQDDNKATRNVCSGRFAPKIHNVTSGDLQLLA